MLIFYLFLFSKMKKILILNLPNSARKIIKSRFYILSFPPLKEKAQIQKEATIQIQICL